MKNTLLLILLLGLVCRVAFAQEEEEQPSEQQEEPAAEEQEAEGQEPAEEEEESVDAMARQKRSAEAGYDGKYYPKSVVWEDKAKRHREAAYQKNRRTKYRDQKLLKKEADRFAAKDLYVRKPGLKLDEKAYVKDHKWRQFKLDARRRPYKYNYGRNYNYGDKKYSLGYGKKSSVY